MQAPKMHWATAIPKVPKVKLNPKPKRVRSYYVAEYGARRQRWRTQHHHMLYYVCDMKDALLIETPERPGRDLYVG